MDDNMIATTPTGGALGSERWMSWLKDFEDSDTTREEGDRMFRRKISLKLVFAVVLTIGVLAPVQTEGVCYGSHNLEECFSCYAVQWIFGSGCACSVAIGKGGACGCCEYSPTNCSVGGYPGCLMVVIR